MLDIGWAEMAMVALLALIVVGPKDLPKMMRTAGQWMRKARSVAREFQSGLDDMMRESELDEARKAIEKTRKFDVQKEVDSAIDPSGELRETAKDVEDTTRSVERDASAASSKGSKTASSESAGSGSPESSSPVTGGESAEATDAAGGEETTTKKARTVRNDAPKAPGNSVKAGKSKSTGEGNGKAGSRAGAKPESKPKAPAGDKATGGGKAKSESASASASGSNGGRKAQDGAKTKKGEAKPKTTAAASDKKN